MPTANDTQRNLMKKWFGSIDNAEPLRFLFTRGYTEEAGMIRPPTSAHTFSREEMACILFLRDEWDYNFVFMPFSSCEGTRLFDGWGKPQ